LGHWPFETRLIIQFIPRRHGDGPGVMIPIWRRMGRVRQLGEIRRGKQAADLPVLTSPGEAAVTSREE